MGDNAQPDKEAGKWPGPTMHYGWQWSIQRAQTR